MNAYGVDRYRGDVKMIEVPEPTVGETDVLVRVHAAGVNQLDVKLAAGEFKAILDYDLPLALGHDVAGVVVATGVKAQRFAVGDEVFGRVSDYRIGTFAERIAVSESDLALKPSSIGMIEAASLPLVALTAWQALAERAHVGAGTRVLIHGGSGGFGSVAVQLAKHLGAYVATTASASNAEWVRELGADEVIDYRSQDFEKVLSGFDVVIDSVGGDNLTKSLRVLRRGGTLISIVGPPDPAFAKQARLHLLLRLAITVLSGKVRRQAKRLEIDYSFLFMRADGDHMTRIAELVDAGALRPIVGRVFPSTQTADALHAVARGGGRGKVVVAAAE